MSFSDRMTILIGEEGLARLGRSTVAVYGLGGVGAACAMDLVRAGVGGIVALDFDRVEESNLNRLYFGYRDEVGRPKAEVFSEYARRINPELRIRIVNLFFTGEGAAEALAPDCDLHIDCVDSLNPKVSLLASLAERDLRFAASMGTAGRLDPTRLRLGSIWESSGCPLAREVRNRLRRRGVRTDFPAVWSDEVPVPPRPAPEDEAERDRPPGRARNIQGSSPFVPQAAGHILASWAVRSLLDLVT